MTLLTYGILNYLIASCAIAIDHSKPVPVVIGSLEKLTRAIICRT